MARKPDGGITIDVLGDDTRAFRLRFRAAGERERETLHERRDCPCCGGGWTERTAQVELENVLAKVQAGIWKRGDRAAAHAPTTPRRAQTFHEYASYWLAAKRSGTLGPAISDNSNARLLWALKHHLLPFFAKRRLDEIDRDLCLAFKERKLTESDELRRTIAAGAKLRHRNGRKVTPLAPASIRDLIGTLAQILDDAVEDGHIPSNPARGKRMRVSVPKPARSFLEQDELAILLDAAAELDQTSTASRATTTDAGRTAAMVAQAAGDGLRPAEIATRLNLSRPTVSYHLKRLQLTPAEPYVGRQALVGTLGYAGPRVSELCDLRIGQLRLHDPDGSRFRITDSKTPTGIREVEISPTLVELLVEHVDRLRRAGLPTGPDAYAFPNTRGGRTSRQRAAQLLAETARAATAKAEKSGMPPLPNVTPHTLRRTYVSIALLASSFDIKWVMSQVGHADSAMTLDVYAQLQQRHQRQHGHAFDKLIKDARERLYGANLGDQVEEARGEIDGVINPWPKVSGPKIHVNISARDIDLGGKA